MVEQPVIHSTFLVERSYPRPPERVFAAFASEEQKRRWFAESDHHEVELFEQDFRVGGRAALRYRFGKDTPFPGAALSNEEYYLDIVPDRRIVSASNMTFGEKCVSASLVTIELLPTDTGTDLVCTFQGAFFEGSDGPEMREGGWRALFERLATMLS